MESLKQIKLAPSEMSFELLIMLVSDVRKRAEEAMTSDLLKSKKRVSNTDSKLCKKNNQVVLEDLDMGDV